MNNALGGLADGQGSSRNSQPATVPTPAAHALTGNTEGPPAFHPASRDGSCPPPVSRERLYFIGNTLLARGTGRDLAPWSIIIFCPECGEVWARVVESPSHTGAFSDKWQASGALCVRHIRSTGSRWYVPGSILPAIRPYSAGGGKDYEWRDLLPPAVLSREAAIHLDWWAHTPLRGQDYWR